MNDFFSCDSTTGTSTSHNRHRDIGPFRLLQQVGEGGMGTVWLAEQRHPIKRRVALKLIRAGLDTKNVLARFEAERQAMAMMNHINVAKMLDAGETECGEPYFVMEFVWGPNITRYCDDARLTVRERLELLIPVCRAIQHAHQKGIIHRDIKPSNILVAMQDGIPVPKVIDFGLAKALQQPTLLTDRTVYTEIGQVIGTLNYMSPEQAGLSPLDVDTRADIYSLGAVLYELLTGSTPLDSRLVQEEAVLRLLEAVRDMEPERPSQRVSRLEKSIVEKIARSRQLAVGQLCIALKGNLDWVLIKALENDRERRYQSVGAFCDDLKRFLNDRAVLAPGPSPAYVVRKWLFRNRALVRLSLTFLLVSLVGFGLATWLFYRGFSVTVAEIGLHQAVTGIAPLREPSPLSFIRHWFVYHSLPVILTLGTILALGVSSILNARRARKWHQFAIDLRLKHERATSLLKNEACGSESLDVPD